MWGFSLKIDCRSGSLYSVSKLLHCAENCSSPPYIFFLNVTTFTPHTPEKPPATAGGPELCFDSHSINRSDKAATVPGTDSALITAVTSTKSL